MGRGPNAPGCDTQCKVTCPLLEETMITCFCRVRVSSYVHTLGAWVSPGAHPAAPAMLPNLHERWPKSWDAWDVA